MRYVTLSPQYMLRGWKDRPIALYDWNCDGLDIKKAVPLTAKQLEAIELVTAPGVSIDMPLLPSALRRAAEKMLAAGVFQECNRKTGLADYQKYEYKDNRFIQLLTWSITGKCNLRCKHCYINADDGKYGELSFAQCEEAVRQMLEAGVYMVAFTGGEPLVRKDFWRLMDLLKANHINLMEILTNGVLITDEFLDRLEKIGRRPQIFILSFDGVNCHDWMRGIPGTERSVIEAIKRLRRWGYPVRLTTVLHAGNLESLLPTYELIKELGVSSWTVATVVNSGNWQKQKHTELNHKRMMDEFLKLLKVYKRDGRPIAMELAGIYSGSPEDKGHIPFLGGCGTKEQEKKVLCEVSRLYPNLLPDGRLLPCIPMSGSIMEDMAPNILSADWSIAKALDESPCETYINKTYADLFANNKECAQCEYRYQCHTCRGDALQKGDFFAKSDKACRFIKGGYAERIRELMEI